LPAKTEKDSFQSLTAHTTPHPGSACADARGIFPNENYRIHYLFCFGRYCPGTMAPNSRIYRRYFSVLDLLRFN